MLKLLALLACVAAAHAGIYGPVVAPVVAHPVAVSHTSSVVHHVPPVRLVHAAPVYHAPVVHAAPLVHTPVVPVIRHAPLITVHH